MEINAQSDIALLQLSLNLFNDGISGKTAAHGTRGVVEGVRRDEKNISVTCSTYSRGPRYTCAYICFVYQT